MLVAEDGIFKRIVRHTVASILADLIYRRASIQSKRQNWEDARRSFIEAIKIAEAANVIHECVPLSFDGLAECYRQMGSIPEAYKLQRKAVSVGEAMLGHSDAKLELLQQKLQTLREENDVELLGSDDESKTLLDKLKEGFKPPLFVPKADAGEEADPGVAGFLWDKYFANGKKEAAQKNWKEAEHHFRAAVERSASLPAKDPRACQSLLALSRVLQEQGKTEETRQCCETALTLAVRNIGEDSIECALCLEMLGDLFNSKRTIGLAKNYYSQAVRAYEQCQEPNSAATVRQKLRALLGQVKEDKRWTGW